MTMASVGMTKDQIKELGYTFHNYANMFGFEVDEPTQYEVWTLVDDVYACLDSDVVFVVRDMRR